MKAADDPASQRAPNRGMGSFLVRRRRDTESAAAAAAVDAAVAPEDFLGVEAPVDVQARAHRYAAVAAGDGNEGLWVLESEGEVVGYATLIEHHRGVLSVGMALVPEARGQGGGRALLDALVKHGKQSSAHKLELEVWLENARAIRLYAAAGFVVEGIRRDHYRRHDGRLRSSMLMSLRVD